MTEIDVLKVAITTLSEALPDVWVADHLPPTMEMDSNLPCVVLDTLPGAVREAAWGGDGFPVRLDENVLDVEVFAQSRGKAQPIAETVRLVLYQLPHIAGTGIVSVECPYLATREDLNPRVKVLGAEAVLVKHS
ncbi:hypothetical protein [Corynebacterium glyciniphilum]|uniref:hypothetical protein n=1 Tax=Corynebacterium glyciniphilum TaxID=1404244 RepID=UPI00265431C4|nr:hypothetical protein [Corynebacterium glyciniphilum]MDN6707078.1 hypothetical protein [Corynebacterium glyciniphilum]